MGQGATVTLRVNGAAAGEARLPRTAPIISSYDETFDVGEDTATPTVTNLPGTKSVGAIRSFACRLAAGSSDVPSFRRVKWACVGS